MEKRIIGGTLSVRFQTNASQVRPGPVAQPAHAGDATWARSPRRVRARSGAMACLPAANRQPVGHAVSTPSTYQERASTGQVELRRDSPKGHGTDKGAEAMTGGNVQLRRQRSGELWWRR
jgi:hypothetical protein